MNYAKTLTTTYRNCLRTLDGLAAKAKDEGRDDSVLSARLSEDMLPLATQIRFVCNMPGEAMARLSGLAFVSREEDPGTLAEAHDRIAQTVSDMDDWQSRSLVAEDEAVELALPNGMTFDLTAGEYVCDWALPQVYFHTTTAYAILRSEGLSIGKPDFVGHMFRYMRPTQ